ncbi:MAG: hypothetical protein ACRDD1_18180, partial [Planctomycetia bacterium]
MKTSFLLTAALAATLVLALGNSSEPGAAGPVSVEIFEPNAVDFTWPSRWGEPTESYVEEAF